MKRITKAERAELTKLAHERAEYATVTLAETDPETADDVIWIPESYAHTYYPHCITLGCERFEIFKTAFVSWIRDTFDQDKIPECNP
jgi:hypothetical protein